MVGRKIETHLFRPISDGWERWQIEPRLLSGTDSSLDKLIMGEDAYLALPARWVISVPLWLPQADLSLAKEMAQVEMDIRGLIPKQKDSVLSVRILDTDTVQNRMLICAQIFPASPFPTLFSHPAFGFFNASPLFVNLEQNTLHLWKEGLDIVAVFSREKEPLYWETTSSLSSHRELLSWLESIAMPLIEQRLLAPTMGFISFLDFDLPAPSFCTRTLTNESFHPTLSETLPSCEWKSSPRRTLEKAHKLKKTYVQIVSISGGVYLLLMISFFGWVGIRHLETNWIRQKIEAIEPDIRNLQEAQRQWNIIVPSIEPSYFPIENLHLIVGQMSSVMWLTQFEFDNQKLSITGEAENVSTAAQFFTNIVRTLPKIQWEMPPPALLSNNKARFGIFGVISNETN